MITQMDTTKVPNGLSSSVQDKLNNDNLSDKKRKRLESKKKKAEAFLALVGHSSKADDKPQLTEGSDSSLVSTTLSPEAQQVLTRRVDDCTGSISTKGFEDTDTAKDEIKAMDPVEEMKALLRERKKAAMQKPKVFLTPEEMVAFRAMPQEPITDEELPPLYVMDLQQLLLYGIQGNLASYKPRWCKILRLGRVASVVCLVVDGIGYDDYLQNKDNFPHISETFDIKVEIVAPEQYGHSLEQSLLNVPLSVSQLKKVNVRVPFAIQQIVRAKLSLPSAGTQKSKKADVTENKETGTEKRNQRLTRKCLLLSTYQMMQEGYPLPIYTNKGSYRNFVFSKDEYEKVTDDSPLFAVDCEMCLTTAKRNELTRVSIVAEDGTLVYDSLVKPRNTIINYLTRFSGITKDMLEPVTTRIEDVHKKFKELLPPDAILCGQSLNSDLLALQMFHPYVIDTSVIFNMSGNRKVKAGLRKLTQFFLGRSIQSSKGGHCSTEDATATLDLVKLKLSKGLEFGDATLSGVYFPDIETYFMASPNTCGQGRENVEQEQTIENTSDKTNSVESTPGSGSVQGVSESDSVGLKHKLSTQVSASVSAKNEFSTSGSTISDKTKLSTSSSCSSSSEDEEISTSRKKRKLDSSGKSSKVEKNSSPPKINPVTSSESSETDDTREPKQLNKTETSTQASSARISRVQREYLFNQCNSVHVPHSFFQLTKEAGRTACIVGEADAMGRYDTEPVEKLIVSSESEVRRTTKQHVQKKGFVLAHFHGPSLDVAVSTVTRHKMMRKLDRRLHSVFKKIPPNALVTIVFKGRSEEEKVQNIAMFMKTT